MDFGFAIEKMKQGERVFRKIIPHRAYGIARCGNEQMISEFNQYGIMSMAVLTTKDMLAEDWERFAGWSDD